MPAHKPFETVKVKRIKGEKDSPASALYDDQITCDASDFTGVSVEAII
jgi:CRISPR-associated protein Csd2